MFEIETKMWDLKDALCASYRRASCSSEIFVETLNQDNVGLLFPLSLFIYFFATISSPASDG